MGAHLERVSVYAEPHSIFRRLDFWAVGRNFAPWSRPFVVRIYGPSWAPSSMRAGSSIINRASVATVSAGRKGRQQIQAWLRRE